MTANEFNTVVEEQLDRCKDILCVKADEYADKANDDRLHNFKIAAGLQGRDPKDSLFGMLTKHLVSVRDMCYSGKSYDIDLWNEKITDSINYFLLLKGLVVEQYNESNKKFEDGLKYLDKTQIKYTQSMGTDEILMSVPLSDIYPDLHNSIIGKEDV